MREDRVHEPGRLSGDEPGRFEVKLGTDYPRAIVDLVESAAANERIYNAAVSAAVGLGSDDRDRADRRSKSRRKK